LKTSILYTSRKTMPAEHEVAEIAAIMAASRSWNEAQGITGGLINTPLSFAQLVEGPAAAVDDLMAKISKDPRHRDVRILRTETIGKVRLPAWAMAYSGPWSFVSRRVEPLVDIAGAPDPIAVDELMRLVVAFAGAADSDAGALI